MSNNEQAIQSDFDDEQPEENSNACCYISIAAVVVVVGGLAIWWFGCRGGEDEKKKKEDATPAPPPVAKTEAETAVRPEASDNKSEEHEHVIAQTNSMCLVEIEVQGASVELSEEQKKKNPAAVKHNEEVKVVCPKGQKLYHLNREIVGGKLTCSANGILRPKNVGKDWEFAYVHCGFECPAMELSETHHSAMRLHSHYMSNPEQVMRMKNKTLRTEGQELSCAKNHFLHMMRSVKGGKAWVFCDTTIGTWKMLPSAASKAVDYKEAVSYNPWYAACVQKGQLRKRQPGQQSGVCPPLNTLARDSNGKKLAKMFFTERTPQSLSTNGEDFGNWTAHDLSAAMLARYETQYLDRDDDEKRREYFANGMPASPLNSSGRGDDKNVASFWTVKEDEFLRPMHGEDDSDQVSDFVFSLTQGSDLPMQKGGHVLGLLPGLAGRRHTVDTRVKLELELLFSCDIFWGMYIERHSGEYIPAAGLKKKINLFESDNCKPLTKAPGLGRSFDFLGEQGSVPGVQTDIKLSCDDPKKENHYVLATKQFFENFKDGEEYAAYVGAADLHSSKHETRFVCAIRVRAGPALDQAKTVDEAAWHHYAPFTTHAVKDGMTAYYVKDPLTKILRKVGECHGTDGNEECKLIQALQLKAYSRHLSQNQRLTCISLSRGCLDQGFPVDGDKLTYVGPQSFPGFNNWKENSIICPGKEKATETAVLEKKQMPDAAQQVATPVALLEMSAAPRATFWRATDAASKFQLAGEFLKRSKLVCGWRDATTDGVRFMGYKEVDVKSPASKGETWFSSTYFSPKETKDDLQCLTLSSSGSDSNAGSGEEEHGKEFEKEDTHDDEAARDDSDGSGSAAK